MPSIIEYLTKIGTLEDTKTKQVGSLSNFEFKYLGLYFTAVWCSYCVKIVHQLPLIVNKVNHSGNNLKLITLRLDEDPSDFAYSYLRYRNISYE